MAQEPETPKPQKIRSGQRNKGQRAHDRLLISRWFRRGYTQKSMKVMLNDSRQVDGVYEKPYPISAMTISKDTRAIIKGWTHEGIKNIDKRRAVELAKLNNLECEAWEAWERSRRDAEKHRTEDSESTGGEHGGGTTRKKSKEVHGRDGNPAFLAQIRAVIEKRCALLGLDAPTLVETNGTIKVLMPEDYGKEEAAGVTPEAEPETEDTKE